MVRRRGAKGVGQGNSKTRFKVDTAQRDFLRAFSELSPDQRLTLNSLMSELLLRASPELLKERQRAARDPSLPFPKTTWIHRMRRTRRGRRLEIIEVTERDSRPGWKE